MNKTVVILSIILILILGLVYFGSNFYIYSTVSKNMNKSMQEMNDGKVAAGLSLAGLSFLILEKAGKFQPDYVKKLKSPFLEVAGNIPEDSIKILRFFEQYGEPVTCSERNKVINNLFKHTSKTIHNKEHFHNKKILYITKIWQGDCKIKK